MIDRADTEQPTPPRKKGWPVLAWVVILALAALEILRPLLAEWNLLPATFRPAPAAAAGDRMAQLQARFQGRYLVGAAHLLPVAQGQNKNQLETQARQLNAGSAGQRLRAIVVIGDLDGPQAALDQLQPLKQGLAAGGPPNDMPQAAALADTLDRLYRDYVRNQRDAPDVTAEERARLRADLGWFGELALAPEGSPDRDAVLRPAERTALGVLIGFSSVGLVGLAGFFGLVLFLVLLFNGWLRSGIDGPFTFGGVYVETFALWMLLFVALSIAAAFVPLPGDRLVLLVGVEFLSLTALAWPLLRGVPWRKLRQDIGWTAGRNPAVEPAVGVACYAMAIPVAALGVALTYSLILLWKQLQGADVSQGLTPRDLPSHPITQMLPGPGWWPRALLLFLAAVAAPIVEETVFRGLLYRHLREATARLGRSGSILLSATLVSFLFAGIHPQGLFAVPALMALAFVFNLVREWRGTLIPSMIAHGLNNGLLLLLFLTIVSD